MLWYANNRASNLSVFRLDGLANKGFTIEGEPPNALIIGKW
jgi:hypothetical protein